MSEATATRPAPAAGTAAGGEMRIESFVTFDALRARIGDWDAFAAAGPGDSPFQRWGWLTAWWHAYGEPGEPLLLLGSEAHGTPAGAAVFYRSHTKVLPGVSLRVLRLVGDGDQEYGDADGLDLMGPAAADPRFTSSVARWLEQNRNAWDVLAINNVLEGSGVAEILGRFRERGWTSHDRSLPRCYLEFGACRETAWPDYLAGTSRKLRTNIQQTIRRGERAGRLELVRHAHGESVREGLRELARLHTARREALGDPGLFADPARTALYQALAEDAGQGLEIWTLSLDGRVVAAEAALRHGFTYLYLAGGFDGRHASLSPGTLLRAHLYPALIADGVRTIDYLTGDQWYKRTWSTRQRTTVHALVTRPGGRARRYLRWREIERAARSRARRMVPTALAARLRPIARWWGGAARRDPFFLEAGASAAPNDTD